MTDTTILCMLLAYAAGALSIAFPLCVLCWLREHTCPGPERSYPRGAFPVGIATLLLLTVLLGAAAAVAGWRIGSL